jgi:fructuronate reductase
VRLATVTIPQLSANVVRPDYDRTVQKCGIVHFGIGAFHRAHQAIYTDDAMNAGDRDWAIVGVSLRSAEVAEQLNPQDGLFTVTERSADRDAIRLVGAVQHVIAASQNPAAVIAAVAARHTHIISITITEKGYCRRADGTLDLALTPGSIYPLLAHGMRQRQQSGLGGLTLLSCDNLANNGNQLQSLMTEYLAAQAPDILAWFDRECTCPRTMVDRIVPATTASGRDRVAARCGVRDEGAIITEPFTQWVIEDRFAGPRPRWEIGGAQFTENVGAFETAKLRMLNGAHSALAYIGIGRGYQFVHQAIADPEIRILIDQMMTQEAAPTIDPAPGQNLDTYAAALITRFANPALNHRLAQIAIDGSQKLPQRWLETLAGHKSRGAECPALLTALAAWLIHVRGDNGFVDDPMAGPLAELWDTHGVDGVVQAVFGSDGLFRSHWVASDKGCTALSSSIASKFRP